MSNLATSNHNMRAIESVLIKGDLSGLTAEQKVNYNHSVCESLGLNPLTKPFEYMRLNGKEILYATKGCAEQLRSIHGISIEEVTTMKIEDVFIVTAKARGKDGRVDSSTGAVSIGNLKGDALANALMKAETKAKRRVTLSICGLNMLDETEVETIPGAEKEVRQSQAALEFDDQDAESESYNLGDYVFPVGRKLKDKRLKDINPDELKQYVQWMKNSITDQGNEPTGKNKEAIEHSEAYLKALEMEP